MSSRTWKSQRTESNQSQKRGGKSRVSFSSDSQSSSLKKKKTFRRSVIKRLKHPLRKKKIDVDTESESISLLTNEDDDISESTLDLIDTPNYLPPSLLVKKNDNKAKFKEKNLSDLHGERVKNEDEDRKKNEKIIHTNSKRNTNIKNFYSSNTPVVANEIQLPRQSATWKEKRSLVSSIIQDDKCSIRLERHVGKFLIMVAVLTITLIYNLRSHSIQSNHPALVQYNQPTADVSQVNTRLALKATLWPDEKSYTLSKHSLPLIPSGSSLPVPVQYNAQTPQVSRENSPLVFEAKLWRDTKCPPLVPSEFSLPLLSERLIPSVTVLSSEQPSTSEGSIPPPPVTPPQLSLYGTNHFSEKGMSDIYSSNIFDLFHGENSLPHRDSGDYLLLLTLSIL